MGMNICYVLLGLAAGAFSGVIGIGGGVIIVPALVLLFGMSLHMAQGTTLVMLIPPIGILAAYNYYREGFVNIPVAVLIGLGFIVGSYFGSKLAVHISEPLLHKFFGVSLFVIGVKFLFFD
jgi:uncharacterized protein